MNEEILEVVACRTPYHGFMWCRNCTFYFGGPQCRDYREHHDAALIYDGYAKRLISNDPRRKEDIPTNEEHGYRVSKLQDLDK